MKRIFPHPILFAAILLMWLLLTRFSLGHLILGSGIALTACWAMARLEMVPPAFKRPGAILKLIRIVAQDILIANWRVARRILGWGHKTPRRSGYVEVQLTLKDPGALALLAIALTACPGTLWVAFNPRSGILLIHVFDLDDGTDWGFEIRSRYEACLKEIFA